MAEVMDRFNNLMGPGRTADDAWQAYQLCLQELPRAAPEHVPGYRLFAAEALLAFIRIKTDGNASRADGRSTENSESMVLWKEHAPAALKLLEGCKAEKGHLALWLYLNAEAFMYLSSSKGLAKAALQGDAGTFKKNVKALIDNCSSFGDGTGYTMMGGFYLNAPWPVGDVGQARKLFEAAVVAFPNCRRNHYFMGVEALRSGRYEDAQEAFTRAIAADVTTVEQEDVAAFLLQQARIGLQMTRA